MGSRRKSRGFVALGVGVFSAAIVTVVGAAAQGQSSQVALPKPTTGFAAIVDEAPTPITAAPPPTTTTTIAPPVTPSTTPAVAGQSYDALGRQALAMISYPWQQRLNVTITFAGPRSGLRAASRVYDDGHSWIQVYVRPGDSAQLLAVNVAHELGHLIDVAYMTDVDRVAWLLARGRPTASWWTCDTCMDYRTGSGDFAETFAAWQVAPIDYRSELAPMPGADLLRSLVHFFRS